MCGGGEAMYGWQERQEACWEGSYGWIPTLPLGIRKGLSLAYSERQGSHIRASLLTLGADLSSLSRLGLRSWWDHGLQCPGGQALPGMCGGHHTGAGQDWGTPLE